MTRADLVVVARVARAHGIRGGLLLDAETDVAEKVFQVGRRLHLVGRDPEAATLTLQSARVHSGRWLVTVGGTTDRTAAERLRGAQLALPRDELPDLGEDDFLLGDLVGMSVVADDTSIGVVADVYENPGHPLLAVSVEGRERLIPFQSDLIQSLDLEGREIHMMLPQGLLDI